MRVAGAVDDRQCHTLNKEFLRAGLSARTERSATFEAWRCPWPRQNISVLLTLILAKEGAASDRIEPAP